MTGKSINPIDRHVGSRVRTQRLSLGMSQEKLGRALGLTFQQVQKYEKGTNRIGASRLQQLAETLQVPVGFFFEGATTVVGAPEPAEGTASPSYVLEFMSSTDALALSKAFMAIKNNRIRRRIVDLVNHLAGQSRS